MTQPSAIPKKRGRPFGALGKKKREDAEYQQRVIAEEKKDEIRKEKKIEKEIQVADTKKKILTLDFPLSARQRLAMEAPEQFVLYGGAKGGGKSWWACVWVLCQAMRYPGNKLFFFRRRSVDFSNTTLETWKKCIPSTLYRINEQKKKIFVKYCNSVIDFGGLDDPQLIQSLNSAEFGGGCVDQAEEIEKDSFGMLRGTLRHKLPDGSFPTFQVRLTANPAQCWLKDEFITMAREGFRYIPALPTDNPFLPDSYVGNLREAFQHRPALLAAYLEGNWDDLSGHDICIQSSWIEKAKAKLPRDGVLKRIIVNDPARFGDDENVIYVMEAGVKFAEGKVSLNADNVLHSQLGCVKFRYQQGRLICESKDDIKKRLQRSPDRADCFIMGLYALDNVNRLDEKEYEGKTVDRVREGTLVDADYQGASDFSGYSGE